ncbi:MAG: hypothetical protein U1F21_16855 [Sphaerotilus natans]
MRWQVAVRSSQDAAAAVRAGALGLELQVAAPERVRAICTQVRNQADGVLIGVTLPQAGSTAALQARLQPLLEAGADRIAVPLGDAATAAPLLRLLATLDRRERGRGGPALVPVLALPVHELAGGTAVDRVESLASLARAEGLRAVLLDLEAGATDTPGAVWRLRPLPARVPALIRALQGAGIEVGVQVAVRREDIGRLVDWAPDSATLVCQERDAQGDPVLDVDRLLERLRDPRTPQRQPALAG